MSHENTDRYHAGMQVRRCVLGDDHVDRASIAVSDLDPDFQRWITEMAWGSEWARGTLDDRTRSLLTIAILAALGRDEMDLHLQASSNTGALPEEIAESSCTSPCTPASRWPTTPWGG